ncbi:MAG: ATP-binding cassette domain-containing protein [Gammaproteobacteria bacterium]|nr:ATP-binding cassette domain-containing protein [Gammaproteobacteria bacterium]
MIKIIKFYQVLPDTEKKALIRLIYIMCLSALFDVIGVASIMPFMTVVSNPGIMESNVYLVKLVSLIKVYYDGSIIFILGIISLVLFIGSIAIKALMTHRLLKTAYLLEHTISCVVLENTLGMSYLDFSRKNTSDLVKTMVSEVQQLVTVAILPAMRMLAHGLAASAIFFLLVYIDREAAFFVLFGILALFGVVFLFLKKRLKGLGEIRNETNQQRFIRATESLKFFKLIKLEGMSKYFVERYSSASRNFATAFATAQIFAQLPRFVLEGAAFGGVLLFILFLLAREDGRLEIIVPTLSVFALAGYKMIPAAQQIFAAIVQLRFSGRAIDTIASIMSSHEESGCLSDKFKAIEWDEYICRNVSYRYSSDADFVLKNFSLTIKKGEIIGISGTSGSGKSTFLNLFCGLLRATSGSIYLDQESLESTSIHRWSRNIIYIPQELPFIDASLVENICLGEDLNNIDQQRLSLVIDACMLGEVVKDNFGGNIWAQIGEGANKLSGGQKQRVGIARALYKANNSIIVFDEATSALDSVTEGLMLEKIIPILSGNTVLFVTHRPATLKLFSRVIDFSK